MNICAVIALHRCTRLRSAAIDKLSTPTNAGDTAAAAAAATGTQISIGNNKASEE